MKNTTLKNNLQEYYVWDRSIRLFHWLNFLCVLALIAIGITILNAKSLGITGDSKVLLKTVHVFVGYIFVLNLLWRIIWGFIGNRYSRWKNILPLEKGFWIKLKEYIGDLKSNNSSGYMGHNPLARLAVTVLFVLLMAQAITGLVLAGTDVYLPPFGHEIAEWVTDAKEDHTKIQNLKPGLNDSVVETAYQEMRSFRKPFILTHELSFYILLIMITLHIVGVIFSEITERSGLASAMITGRKVFSQRPKDEDLQK